MLNVITTEALYELYLKAGQQVCTDTRKLENGSIFFALKGGNFNANEFAQKAVDAGCLAAIVDEEKYANGTTLFLVSDVLKSLQALANHHRKQFTIPFLAITGSNGKTTNKELIMAVLSKKYHTLATIGNLNNHIGVPLTLLRLTKEHEFAIIEMGANHQGEIQELCTIADPDYGLITNIGKAHLEGFGGIEGVKKGKSEMYRYLKAKNAKVFINGDDEVLFQLAFDNDKITYGCKKLYDTIGKDLTNNADMVKLKFTTRYGEKDWNKIDLIETQIIGTYNFINCLAAAAVGNYFKVDSSAVKSALETYQPNMNRSQLFKTKTNTLILDAYNANPNSMQVAIENFAGYKAPHKVVILGDMFELGEHSEVEHQRIIEQLKEHSFDEVILVGEHFYKLNTKGFVTFKSTAECHDYLAKQQYAAKTVLIKGSRGMKMEILQEVL